MKDRIVEIKNKKEVIIEGKSIEEIPDCFNSLKRLYVLILI